MQEFHGAGKLLPIRLNSSYTCDNIRFNIKFISFSRTLFQRSQKYEDRNYQTWLFLNLIIFRWKIKIFDNFILFKCLIFENCEPCFDPALSLLNFQITSQSVTLNGMCVCVCVFQTECDLYRNDFITINSLGSLNVRAVTLNYWHP